MSPELSVCAGGHADIELDSAQLCRLSVQYTVRESQRRVCRTAVHKLMPSVRNITPVATSHMWPYYMHTVL